MNESIISTTVSNKVLRLQDIDFKSVSDLLTCFGLALEKVVEENDIPGSYWGDDEAGLIGNRLLARADTPLHSILHETCHYICMDHTRRVGIHTDAGGDYDEENGVCYLQILLADHMDGFGQRRMLDDMDHWGYTFRLGSAQAWFEKDAKDAVAWLQRHLLIDSQRQPTWNLRKE